MFNLRSRWLAVLLAVAFFASACGGETSDDSADDTGDDATSADSDDTADSTDDSDDTGDDSGDAPTETTGADGSEDVDSEMPEDDEAAGPNIYEDPRGGIFLEFQ